MSDVGGRRGILSQTNIHLKRFDPVSFLKGGGTKSESFGKAGLKRSETSARPKVLTDQAGRISVTREGGKGARILARMGVGRPVNPKVPNPGGTTRMPVSTGNTVSTTGHSSPTHLPPVTVPGSGQTSRDRQIRDIADRGGDLRRDAAKLNEKGASTHTVDQLLREGDKTIDRVNLCRRGDAVLDDTRKLLTTLGDELKSERAKPTPDAAVVARLQTEIAALRQARRDVLAGQIGVEFNGLAESLERPLPKSGTILALAGLHGPGLRSAEPGIVSLQLIDDLAKAIDTFNDGAKTVTMSGGKTIDLAGLKALVDDLATLSMTAGDKRLGRAAGEALGKLSDAIALRLAVEAATTSIEALLDRDPDFPVSAALKSIASGFPNLRAEGNATDHRRTQAAAMGLETIARMIASGEDLPQVQGLEPRPMVSSGPDKSFDGAYLKLKQAGAGDRLVRDFVASLPPGFSKAPDEALLAAARKPFETLSVGERAALADFARQTGIEGGLAAHRLIGLFDRYGGTEPDKDLIAAARTDAGQLMVKERARLQDYVNAGNAPDVETARTRIRAFADQVERLRDQGRTVATMRHELNAINRNLGDVLTADRRRLFQPSTWRDAGVRVFDGVPNSVVKDETLLKALRTFGNKATAEDVIILFARVATFERKTLALENELFGLYPNLDTSEPRYDPEKPLEQLGISNAALKKLGVPIETRDPITGQPPDNVKKVLDSVEQMAKQGIRGFSDAENAIAMISKVSKLVLKSELTHDMIRHYEGESARAVGQHLLAELLKDADAGYRKERGLPPGTAAPTVGDPIVVKAFQQRTLDVELSYKSLKTDGTVDETRFDRLKGQARSFARIEGYVVDAYRESVSVDERVAEKRKLLETKGKDLGLDLDPSSPRGLRSAKALLTALREHDLFVRYGTSGPRERRDAALESLKGFDLDTMRRPWHAKMKAAFGGGDRFEIASMSPQKLEDLRSIAEAIVFLREDGPKLKDLAVNDVKIYSAMLDERAAARRKDNPAAIRTVNDMVRLAGLNEWRTRKSDFEVTGGRLKEGFNPADPDVRQKIEKTLTGWGLDLEAFRPEIDEVVHSRMTVDDLLQWAKDTNWSDATIERYRQEHPKTFSREGVASAFKSVLHAFTPDGLMHRSAMDADTRDSLISLLTAFQEGDKLDLKSGQKITLDSGKIPVEPSGLAGLKAKLSGSHIAQFEVERGSDGLKLHLRSGFGGTIGLEAIVGKKFKFGDNAEARLDCSAGFEAGGSKLTGVSITFENSEKGVKALVDLVGKMIDGGKASIGDLSGATDVGRGSEGRSRIATNAQGVGRLAVGGKGPELSGKKDTLGVGVSGQVGITLARGTKTNVSTSNNETTYKGEIEYSLAVNSGLNFYANLYNPMNMGTGALAGVSGGQKTADGHFGKDADDKSLYDISSNVQSTDLLGVGISTSLSFTDKWKQVTDPAGFFTKSEKVRQSNVVQSRWEAFAVAGNEVEKLLKKPGNEELAGNFRALMDLAGPGDFVQVTFGLKKDDMEKANAFVRMARQARAEGRKEEAANFLKFAQAIVDNGAYVPEKIAIVKTSVQKSEVANVNARWIRWDTIAEGKSEHTEVTLKFPT